MNSVPRSRSSRIPAALGLAVLVAVGWILLRIGNRSGSETGATADAASFSSPAAGRTKDPISPSAPRKGRRRVLNPEATPDASMMPSSDEIASDTDEAEETLANVVLLGRVTGRAGETVGGPNTLVELKTEKRVLSVPVVQGSYRIEDLANVAPGTFELRCSAPGLREEVRSITIAPDEKEHREDFVLEPVWTVAIRLVTPERQNLLDPDVQRELPKDEKIEIVATEAPPPARWIARSFEDGIARRGSRYVPRARADEAIPGDPDGACSGRIEIFRKPPVHLAAEMRGIVLATTRLDSEVALATLVIPLEALRAVPCSLRARVVAVESGIPIANATAMLYLGERSTIVPVDGEGILLGRDLPPGRSTLIVDAEGRGGETRQLDLQPSIENDLGTIALDGEVRIRGRFVDPSGQMVESDAYVLPYARERPLETLDTCVYVGLDRDSRNAFEVFGLSRRTYVLMDDSMRMRGGREGWWVLPTLVDLSRGSVEDLDVPVVRATDVALRPVTDELRDLQYWVLAPNGLLCAHGVFPNRGDVELAVGPGNFWLLVGRDPSNAREIPFSVGSAATVVQVGP